MSVRALLENAAREAEQVERAEARRVTSGFAASVDKGAVSQLARAIKPATDKVDNTTLAWLCCSILGRIASRQGSPGVAAAAFHQIIRDVAAVPR